MAVFENAASGDGWSLRRATCIAQRPPSLESGAPAFRSTRVFARPFVITWIAIWLLNDHVLKQHFASWWTGKLSDIAGLIIFPLIVAALIERCSRRPVEWAAVATVVFYGSINLFAVADAATERMIGQVIGPVTLTMDPTDLLVLPAVGGALWAWSTVPSTSLRRSWGRIMFAAAIATTLATSPPSTKSETFAGTVLLTDDIPSVEIPIVFTLDGENSDDVAALQTQLAIVPYGLVPSNPVIETLEFSEPGVGVFELALGPGVSGPVEVTWLLYARTEGEGGLFGGTDPAEPVLTAITPVDMFGPEPVLEVGLQIPGPGDAPAHRLTVEAGPNTTLRIVTTKPARKNFLRVVTEDVAGWLTIDTPVDLTRPARCDEMATEPCRFDIYIAGARRWDTIDLVVLALEGSAEVIDQGAVVMNRHTITGSTPTYRFESPGERAVRVDVSFDPIADPVAAAMTFVEMSLDESVSNDDVLVQSWWQALSFASECCADVQVTTWHHNNDLLADDAFDELLEFELNWEAIIWTPAEINPESITVTIE